MKTQVLRSAHDLNFPKLFKHLWHCLNHYIPLHSYSTLVQPQENFTSCTTTANYQYYIYYN